MNKQQTLFILSILLLISGVSLDIYGVGIIANIIIIIGGVTTVLLSINHKKEAISDCTRLENEIENLETKSQSMISEVEKLQNRIITIESINSITQKHFEEIQKANTKEELTNNFINSICNDLKASKGAFFLEKDKIMTLTSSFAYSSENEEPLKFELGEGLIGQAALNNKQMFLKDIPDDYIEINSGLGNAKPKNIVIQPVTYNNKVLGIVELATFSTLSEEELNVLTLIAGNIATKLSSFNN